MTTESKTATTMTATKRIVLDVVCTVAVVLGLAVLYQGWQDHVMLWRIVAVLDQASRQAPRPVATPTVTPVPGAATPSAAPAAPTPAAK